MSRKEENLVGPQRPLTAAVSRQQHSSSLVRLCRFSADVSFSGLKPCLRTPSASTFGRMRVRACSGRPRGRGGVWSASVDVDAGVVKYVGSCGPFHLVARSTLWPVPPCGPLDLVARLILCPVRSCVPFDLVSRSILCLVRSCVPFDLVSGSILCPVRSCVLFDLVSRSILCPVRSCVPFDLVSRSILCPVRSCVPFDPVSRSILRPVRRQYATTYLYA